MIKLIKDVIFGEPVVSITIISLVLTSWLAALTQLEEFVPLWLAVAAPAFIALGGVYQRAVTSPTRPDQNGAPAEDARRGIHEIPPDG